MRLFLCPWEFSDHLRGTDGHSHPAPAFALPVIRKWESCHWCCLCLPSPPLSHPVACHAPQLGSYSEGQPFTQTPFPSGARIPTLGWANKVTPQLRLNHLFTDSTYVLGTWLVAKNNSCIMERKFTFVGISQPNLVGYPFLCSSDTVYLHPNSYWSLIHLSFPARQTLVIYHHILELGEEPGSVGFQSLFLYTFVKCVS